MDAGADKRKGLRLGDRPSKGAGGRRGLFQRIALAVHGQNLKHVSAVAFNGVRAGIVTGSTTMVVTEVPAGATTGRVTVMTPDGTAISPESFRVKVANY